MQIEVGAVVSGKVTGITEFGAFVETEAGKTGMVHISEVSSGYVKDIKDHLSIGQEVKCKVISVSPEGKISLSIKKVEAENNSDGTCEPAPARRQAGRDSNRPAPKVWQGRDTTEKTNEKQSFEDMMAKFQQVSAEKLSDLKKNDSKRGSMGYSRNKKN